MNADLAGMVVNQPVIGHSYERKPVPSHSLRKCTVLQRYVMGRFISETEHSNQDVLYSFL